MNDRNESSPAAQERHVPRPIDGEWRLWQPVGEPPVIKQIWHDAKGRRVTSWIGTIHGSSGWTDAERTQFAQHIINTINARNAEERMRERAALAKAGA
jgi:hypothetical protein